MMSEKFEKGSEDPVVANASGDAIVDIRRSDRDKMLTEKGEAYLSSLFDKHVTHFNACYNKWKVCVKDARSQLKAELSEAELKLMSLRLESLVDNVLRSYEDIKFAGTPGKDEVRKADCVIQITKDVCEVIEKYKQTPYNQEIAKVNVRTLLDKTNCKSVFGDSNTETGTGTSKPCSTTSRLSRISSKRSEAVVELAMKKAKLESLQNIRAQRLKLKEEEERLEMLKLECEVKMAEARVKAYDYEIEDVKPVLEKPKVYPSSTHDDTFTDKPTSNDGPISNDLWNMLNSDIY